MKNSKLLGIYIHIPFCISKCYYCDFVSESCSEDIMRAYVAQLIKEIEDFPQEKDKYTVDTVYIGGGTPSVLPAGSIAGIMNAVAKNYRLSSPEVSIEVNPGTISHEKIREYKSAGVNRVSVGLQSADDRLLAGVGRIHSYHDFLDAIEIITAANIYNISADVMLGLPGQTTDIVDDTLEKITGLPLKHISVYALKVEEGTRLAGTGFTVDEDLAADMYGLAAQKLDSKGFKRYEVSNFAKEGYESRHNLKYWRLLDYAGYGVAAHSYLGGRRFFNQKNIKRYIDGTNERQEEETSPEDFRTEYIMLNLRTADGICLADYQKLFGHDLSDVKKNAIAKQIKYGNIEVVNGRLKLTSGGFYVMNSIITDLL